MNYTPEQRRVLSESRKEISELKNILSMLIQNMTGESIDSVIYRKMYNAFENEIMQSLYFRERIIAAIELSQSSRFNLSKNSN